MQDESRIEHYRCMTLEERWRETEKLMTFAWRSLLEMTEDERNRRLDLLCEQHERGGAIILDQLRKCT